jgi:hypothetical protein
MRRDDDCCRNRFGRIPGESSIHSTVELSSVVAAVCCALEIQKATAEAEPGIAQDKRIRYRNGHQSRSVLHDEGELHGLCFAK